MHHTLSTYGVMRHMFVAFLRPHRQHLAMSGYSVGLVGEQHYQAAIARVQLEDEVLVVHEVGNPYDDHALAVITAEGETIGYIPKSSWLRRAIHVDGRGCSSTIKAINGHEILGVVISVWLDADTVPTQPYPDDSAQSVSMSKTLDLIARIRNGVFK